MKKILLGIVAVCIVLGVSYFFYNKEAIAPGTTDENLTEKTLVENYIRDNIKTIAPDKPVLGGNWYVTAVQADPASKTGTMAYEDGHIEGTATAFTYTYIKSGDEVLIKIIPN